MAPFDLKEEILRLKEERNAIILAHSYQTGDIQDMADYVGDSLGLAYKAQNTDCDVIAFCGVHFMAETAKILNPDKTVILPDADAGCSLEASCDAGELEAFLKENAHKNYYVVAYVNCSIGVKALADVIVTSGNAVKIVSQAPEDRPILFVLTVCTAPEGESVMHGLFIGEGRSCLTEAVKLAQEKNIDFVEHGIKRCVVYLDPMEFKTTWLGNKAVYRTRMAIADGGELIILAPGVTKFGEDAQCDKLIRKYGYRGRLHTLEAFNKPENSDLRESMGAAAHLIHGSGDGRFSITYAVKDISQAEIESAGFQSASYDEMAKKYDPAKLHYGYNTVDGEEVYFIPNPALGLWMNREKFET